MNIFSSLKIKLSLLLILTTSFSFAQINELQFEKTKQSFKKVNEGAIITLDYYFEYVGNDTLSMLPPEVDCSCTEIKLENADKIIPNQKYLLQVVFNTNDKIGYQEREVGLIFITQKSTKQLKQKLIFRGVVKATKATKEKFKQLHN